MGYLGEVVDLSDSIMGCSGGVADLWDSCVGGLFWRSG